MRISPSGGLLSPLLCLTLIAATRVGADPAVEAISLASHSAPKTAGGNSDSAASVLSADGKFVLFLSTANNLVTNDDNGRFLDVFLRNRTNNTTTLVSVNLTGTGPPDIRGDRRSSY